LSMNEPNSEAFSTPVSPNRNWQPARRARLRGVGVVGLGYWGPNHVRNLYDLRCAEQVYVCDLDSKRREHIHQLYPGVVTLSDFDELLTNPDIEGVIVATPVSHHFPMARAALQAGKSVLVEKPLAMSRRQALELIKLAQEKRSVLMVGHTFEYSAPVLKIKQLLDSGALGDIFYISSTRANLGLFQRDVNVAWDLATHDISIINMLMGRAPIAVSCQGHSHYRDRTEDVALLTLDFGNSVVAFIHVSWLDPNKIRRTTIVGSRQMLVYDDTSTQEKIRIYDKGVNVLPYYDTYGQFQFSYRYGDIQIPRIEEAEPLKLECEHFVSCVGERTVPRTDGLSGLRVVSVLEAADESLRSEGRPIAVQVGEDADA
jgi:predicted dehydrogenase